MARAKINLEATALIGLCDELTKSDKLNVEQAMHVEQLIALASPLAARCRLNPFRTVGLSEPTDSMDDIEETARQRLETVGRVTLTALGLDRFPAVCALAEFLEHRIELDLKALRACHEADRLETYAQWHRRRWSGVLADAVPHQSATPAGVQAQAGGGMHPRGGCSDWS